MVWTTAEIPGRRPLRGVDGRWSNLGTTRRTGGRNGRMPRLSTVRGVVVHTCRPVVHRRPQSCPHMWVAAVVHRGRDLPGPRHLGCADGVRRRRRTTDRPRRPHAPLPQRGGVDVATRDTRPASRFPRRPVLRGRQPARACRCAGAGRPRRRQGGGRSGPRRCGHLSPPRRYHRRTTDVSEVDPRLRAGRPRHRAGPRQQPRGDRDPNGRADLFETAVADVALGLPG